VLSASPAIQNNGVRNKVIAEICPMGSGPVTHTFDQAGHVHRSALELGLLSRARLALEGHPQFVELVGAAGSGKTRLVKQLAVQSAALAWWKVLTSQAIDSGVEPEPLGPIIGLFGQNLAAMESSASKAELRHWAPCWLLNYPGLLDEEELKAIRAETQRVGLGRVLREGVALTLEWARKAPLMLVLEDVHWADASTTEWLIELMRACSTEKLFVVVTRRPTPASMASARLSTVITARSTEGTGASLSVSGFDEAEVREYLLLHGLGAEKASRLALPFTTATGGLPFFVKVATEAYLTRSEELHSEWIASGSVDIAGQFRNYLITRISGLPDTARRLLDLFACLVVVIPLPLLADCIDVPEVEANALAEGLVRMGLLTPADNQVVWCEYRLVRAFGISHELFREVLRNELTIERWRALNRCIALSLQKLKKDLRTDWSTFLALAYTNAGMPAEAVEAFRMSCSRSMKRNDVRSARSMLELALQNISRMQQDDQVETLRLELLWELSKIQMLEHGTTSQEVEATRSQILSVQAHSPRARFLMAETRSAREIFTGRGDLAEDSCLKLLSAAEGQGYMEAASAYMWAGSAAMSRGHVQDAELFLSKAIHLTANEPGASATELRLHASIHRAWTVALAGRFDMFVSSVLSLEQEIDALRSSYLMAILKFWNADALRQLGCSSPAKLRYIKLTEICEYHDIALFREEALVGVLLSEPPRERKIYELFKLLNESKKAQGRKFTFYKLVIGVIETLIANREISHARELMNDYAYISRFWPFHSSELLRLQSDFKLLDGQISEAGVILAEAMEIDIRNHFIPGIIRSIQRCQSHEALIDGLRPYQEHLKSSMNVWCENASQLPGLEAIPLQLSKLMKLFTR
jgi:hypothetical protein